AADMASRVGAASPADTPKTQAAPPAAPAVDSPKPPAEGAHSEPPPSSASEAAADGKPLYTVPEKEKAPVAMPSDAKPKSPKDTAETPNATPNPEVERMREELERMRAELEKYKQPAATRQDTDVKPQEAKAAEATLPPPLPKQETATQRQEPPSEAIPAVLVDDNDDGYDGNATIQLKAYSGKTMTITGDTIVNFSNTRTLNGDDFQFLDHNEQYRISRQGTKWIITPGMNTKNATMLNYLPLTGPEVLEDEDTISVSIPGSNVHKMMLTVKFTS
ncbi:MAG: hypothetical protein J5833_01135, partial [Victivallales bacterium]|nr:hypothetical protein [Victivallales bacterium]